MRSLTAAFQAAVVAEVVRPAMLVALDVLDDPVYATSAPFDIRHEGQTYLGVGGLGKISAIEEGTEVKPYGITLQISGIPASRLESLQNARIQGRSARVLMALLDADHRVIGSPVVLFAGRMDVLSIEIGQQAVVTVNAESRLTDWQRPRVRRYTDRDQQDAFPGDLGLQYVAATTDAEITWGLS